MDLYPTAAKAMQIFSSFSGKQRGDPAKAAERIVEAATGTGLAGALTGKALRVPLGADCWGRFEAKVKALQENVELTKEVAGSTDILE